MSRILKILVQNRPNALTQPGGDTVVMLKTIEALKKLGVQVTLDLECAQNPRDFDLAHLFNLATPDYTRALAQRLFNHEIPFVVTTLIEDVPQFHNQSHAWGQFLCSYVKSGQSKAWAGLNTPKLNDVLKSQRFENSWTVKNAAGLFVTGPREGQVLSRDYGVGLPIFPIYLGCEVATEASADLFFKTYGIKDFVLCVGRIETRKNQLSLLAALEDSEVPVVIAGSGFTYQPGYAEAVNAFKRKGNTLVLGRLAPEMLASAYKAAKVHALPSFYELPGLVTLEAAYYGCNVVASRASGTIEDYLANHGFYCDPADLSSIKSAVELALEKPRNKKTQEDVSRFSWDNLGQQTLAAYRKILKIEDNLSQSSNSKGAYMAPTFDMDSEATNFQDTLERAELAAKAGKADEAKKLFTQAKALNPDSARLHMGVGALLLSINDIKGAQLSFDHALEIDSNNVKALIGRGMCEAYKKSHITAYGYFIKALQISPRELVAIHQLIECSFTLNRFDDVTMAIERFLGDSPNDHEMRFCLAGCKYKLGQIVEAKKELAKVMASNPQHKGARELAIQIANVESSQNSNSMSPAGPSAVAPVQAVEKRETLIVMPPASRNTEIDLRLAELNEKKRNREIEDVKVGCDALAKMRDITPDQSEFIQILKAEVAILEGALEVASSIYDSILSQSPQCARALCGRAALKANGNSWAEAKTLFEKALSADRRCDIALAGLGMCAAQEQNFNKAWDYYTQAIGINSENLRAVLGIIELGYPLKRLADVEKAVRGYLDLHPADCNFIYSLAGCLFAQNRLAEAMEELNRLSMFEPNNQHAAELKNMILEKGSKAALSEKAAS
jgi:glycosyltransferase involved in cell wall biosynthesis/Tfp pilus assembly protein PilF